MNSWLRHLSLTTDLILGVIVTGLMAVSVVLIFCYAPTEATMGEVQRILYFHVSVAWCGLAGGVAMALCGAMYLTRRQLAWDQWSQAAGEIGWLCTTLTLVTGSIWAHEAWNTWWTWEPRLTSSLVLWMIFAGIFLVRSGLANPHQRARVGALLAILGAADIPLVLVATRWFRGIHPVSPEMESSMRLTLLVSIISFTALFALLVVRRRQHLHLLQRVSACETALEDIVESPITL